MVFFGGGGEWSSKQPCFGAGYCYSCPGAYQDIARLQLVQTQDLLEPLLGFPYSPSLFFFSICKPPYKYVAFSMQQKVSKCHRCCYCDLAFWCPQVLLHNSIRREIMCLCDFPYMFCFPTSFPFAESGGVRLHSWVAGIILHAKTFSCVQSWGCFEIIFALLA